MEEVVSASVSTRRITLLLLGLFSGLALVLAAIGIYGVIAYSVSQRTREIGVRMALGAGRGSVIGMVVRQGLGLAVMGVVAGTVGAALLTKLMASLLYSTSPTDAFTFAGVSAVFLLVAGMACFVPARQVTAIDPLTALRQD